MSDEHDSEEDSDYEDGMAGGVNDGWANFLGEEDPSRLFGGVRRAPTSGFGGPPSDGGGRIRGIGGRPFGGGMAARRSQRGESPKPAGPPRTEEEKEQARQRQREAAMARFGGGGTVGGTTASCAAGAAAAGPGTTPSGGGAGTVPPGAGAAAGAPPSAGEALATAKMQRAEATIRADPKVAGLATTSRKAQASYQDAILEQAKLDREEYEERQALNKRAKAAAAKAKATSPARHASGSVEERERRLRAVGRRRSDVEGQELSPAPPSGGMPPSPVQLPDSPAAQPEVIEIEDSPEVIEIDGDGESFSAAPRHPQERSVGTAEIHITINFKSKRLSSNFPRATSLFSVLDWAKAKDPVAFANLILLPRGGSDNDASVAQFEDGGPAEIALQYPPRTVFENLDAALESWQDLRGGGSVVLRYTSSNGRDPSSVAGAASRRERSRGRTPRGIGEVVVARDKWVKRAKVPHIPTPYVFARAVISTPPVPHIFLVQLIKPNFV